MAPTHITRGKIGRPKDSPKLFALKQNQNEAERAIHRSSRALALGTKNEHLKTIGLDPSMPNGTLREIISMGLEQWKKANRDKKQQQKQQQKGVKIVKNTEIRGKKDGRIANSKVVKSHGQRPNFVPKMLPAERIHQQQQQKTLYNHANQSTMGKKRIVHAPKAQPMPQLFSAPSNGTSVGISIHVECEKLFPISQREDSSRVIDNYLRKQLEIEKKRTAQNKRANAIGGIGHNGSSSSSSAGQKTNSNKFVMEKHSRMKTGNNSRQSCEISSVNKNGNAGIGAGPLKRTNANGNGGG